MERVRSTLLAVRCDHVFMTGIRYDLTALLRPSRQADLVGWFEFMTDVKPDQLQAYFADVGVIAWYEPETVAVGRVDEDALARNYRRQVAVRAISVVDMDEPRAVQKLVEVAEEVLKIATGARRGTAVEDLRGILQDDGFQVSDEGAVSLPSTVRLIEIDLSAIGERAALVQQMSSIERQFHSDPHEALTPIRAMVETSLKLVIERQGDEMEGLPSIPKLFKAARPSFERLFGECGISKVDELKGLVGSVANISQTVGNLRNDHSLSHGGTHERSLDPRLARMALDSAILIVNVCMDVLALPDSQQGP